MRRVPFDLGPIHFVGIGGIGMSGIAEVMKTLGYRVQGSDASDNANVKRLQGLGISVAIGQKAENLGDAKIVVISSAIKAGNPELDAARAKQLPVVKRAEMLAELMRLKWSIAIGGTHGKTTTTTMVATLLDAGGLDPTVINGGIINAYGTNARLGQGEWMVVEADESDGTLVKLPATIAVVTNIDPEHLDHYGSFEGVKQAFLTFVENVPFYGLGILCLDHPEVQALVGRVTDRRIVTYGFSAQADIRAIDVGAKEGLSTFTIVIADRVKGGPARLEGVTLPMPGPHNVQNALVAIAVGRELGLSDAVMVSALGAFSGVKRRFTITGSAGGVTVVDDYGHHPVEIAAVMRAARQVARRNVIAIVQPHRYTRLRDLFDQFCTCLNDADTVIVTDVYPAGEAPIPGIDRDALIAGLRDHGHRDVRRLEGPEALAPMIADLAQEGDYVVCLGAGSITNWAQALPKQLADLAKGGRA
ncbi:MAG: UDP-N-acetylmuramate--L-alanine ligase [Alphaproteobacteria bacterium]|nr:UDP-N-acetylmuramate--L-alanine ligase [Alphaproteobacteria bacterium]